VATQPHQVPRRDRRVKKDVAIKGVAVGREDLAPPACVGGRGGVEHDGDQVLDVRDPVA
jgi:hypothetical protein